MKVDILLGLQWGDEGKGKIVDVLTPQYDIIARFQGGPNAGHTLEFDGRKHVLHTIPSGIFREDKLNLIGNGVVIDPVIFQREISEVSEHGVDVGDRLLISRKAHLILPTHRLLDAANEQDKGKNKIGSTLRGIGPTYMDKTGRNGLRVGDIFLPDFQARYDRLVAKHKRLLGNFPEFKYDLSEHEPSWFEAIDKLRAMQVIDSEQWINDQLDAGKRVWQRGRKEPFSTSTSGPIPMSQVPQLPLLVHALDSVLRQRALVRSSASSKPIAPEWDQAPSPRSCSEKRARRCARPDMSLARLQVALAVVVGSTCLL